MQGTDHLMKTNLLTFALILVLDQTLVSLGDTTHQPQDSGANEQAHLNQGIGYINDRQWDKAILEMNEALRFNPTNTIALEYRAGAHFANGHLEQAVTDYGLVIKIDPKNDRALYNRGAAYSAKEEFDKALLDFDRCLRLNPTNDLAYKARADIYYYKKGDFRKAVEDYRKALKLTPDDARIMNVLAWLYASCSDKLIRSGEQASVLAEKACALTGWKNSDYIDTLAAAYAEIGDFEKAVKYQQQALAVAGSSDIDKANRLELYRDRKPYSDPMH
jgi:tetratricopeptide (TPR) repeat protein